MLQSLALSLWLRAKNQNISLAIYLQLKCDLKFLSTFLTPSFWDKESRQTHWLFSSPTEGLNQGQSGTNPAFDKN